MRKLLTAVAVLAVLAAGCGGRPPSTSPSVVPAGICGGIEVVWEPQAIERADYIVQLAPAVPDGQWENYNGVSGPLEHVQACVGEFVHEDAQGRVVDGANPGRVLFAFTT
jgi:hypothetical protein